jgi:polyhydroxybutyrate depolymerase
MKVTCCFILFTLFFSQAYAGVRTDSVLVQGYYRTFHFYEPTGKTIKHNLIFILHGSGGNGEGMMKPAANLQAIAGQEPLFLVFPDGYKRYWNECRKLATSEANKENVDEQSFFTAMLNYFVKHYQVNDKGFFAIGLSGGGHMAYKLAMTMPGKFKAISAIVANLPGTTNLDCSEAKKPVAVMITNSTEDDLNPYNGGKMVLNGANWGEVRSTERSFQYWAALAGYQGPPNVDDLPDRDTSNNQTITRYTFKHRDKPEITLLRVNGGVHAFPKDIDIFLESWAFFKKEIQREGNDKR